MKVLSIDEVDSVSGGVTAYEAGEFCGRVVGKSVVMIGAAIGIAAGVIYALNA